MKLNHLVPTQLGRKDFAKRMYLLFILGILLIGSPLYAQYHTGQYKRFVSNTHLANDNYGESVALSGDIMAVGAVGHSLDENGLNSVSFAGAVFIHSKDQGGTGNWGFVKKIVAQGTNARNASDYFGRNVAMSGDILIVSSENDYDETGANVRTAAGAVFIYSRNQGGTDNWGLVKKIAGTGTNGRLANDYFGTSISISGSTLIVGSYNPTNETGASSLTSAGAAYIFSKDQGGTDNWGLVKKIVGTGTNGRKASDVFGGSVSISGDLVVVGAPFQDWDDAGANKINSDPGAAYIFSRNQGGADNWGIVKKIVGTGTNGRLANNYFGTSVAVDGNIIVVGSNGQAYDESGSNALSSAGAVFIYYKDEGGTDNWGIVQKIVGQGTNGRLAGDNFGKTLSISGNLILVSAPGQKYDQNGANSVTNAGAAYLFYKDIGGTDNWGIVNKIVAQGTNARGTNNYYEANAISGDVLAFGGPSNGYDQNGANYANAAGAVVLHQLNDLFYSTSTWTPSAPSSTTENYSCYIYSGSPSIVAGAHVTELAVSSGATPTLAGTITVDSAFTNNGVISGTGNVELAGSIAQYIYGTGTVSNLVLNNSNGATISDSLMISSVLTLTSGVLTTGGKLVLDATSSSVYGQIATSGSGSISGNIIVEKVLSNTNSGWRQIGIPVNTTITNLSGIDLLGSAHGTSNEQNIYYWDASIQTGSTAKGWTVSTIATDDYTKVYSIYSNNSSNGLHDISTAWRISGAYLNGDQSYSLYATDDPNASGGAGSEKTGWNLVPNPYASNLDVSIGSAFWNASAFASYKSIHIWDVINSQYIGICSTGVSMTQYNNTGSTNSSTVLAPFQAFWVNVSANSTLTLTNSMRSTSMTGLGTFMKREIQTVRVNISDAEGDWDQFVLYEHVESTQEFDLSLDAFKRFTMNSGVPSVYHSVPTGEKASIKSYSSTKDEMEIALSFKNEGGEHLKFFLDLDEMDADFDYFLKDNQANTLIALSNWDTLEIAVSGTVEGRYALVMKKKNPTSIEPVSLLQAEIEISGDGHYAFVRGLEANESVQYELVDMRGIIQVSGTLKQSTSQGIIDLSNQTPGVYIVRLPQYGANAKVIYTGNK